MFESKKNGVQKVVAMVMYFIHINDNHNIIAKLPFNCLCLLFIFSQCCVYIITKLLFSLKGNLSIVPLHMYNYDRLCILYTKM